MPAAKGKKSAANITKIQQLAGRRIGVVGRTPANVNLLKVILQQYGVDASKIEIAQFPANEAAEAIRNQKADSYLAAGPVNSKITTDAINASTRDGQMRCRIQASCSHQGRALRHARIRLHRESR